MFRLMVTMVAEFCSLVIFIHNTLLGEIIISSVVHELQGYTSIPQYIMIKFQVQRFKFIDFMVIKVHFFRRWKTWTKCGNHFSDIMYILHHNFCIYRLSFTHSTL